MKKAIVYNPYLDTLGGGEKYTLCLVKTLLDHNWLVDISWDSSIILSDAIRKFGFELKGANLISPNWINLRYDQKWKKLKKYDLIFWVSDGSVPLLLGPRKKWIHFQVPFQNVSGRDYLTQVKLKTFNNIICNSEFTAGFINTEFQCHASIIYPPVDINQFVIGEKEKYILYVGRFSKLLQDKAHKELIMTFINFLKINSKGYKLQLAGSTESTDAEYINYLKSLAKDAPIEIILNPSFGELKNIYSKASFFWSLAGLNANETLEPDKCEHFGITVVEAMASGCIPILLNKGGHREIIEDGINGYLVKHPEQMISITNQLDNFANLNEIRQKVIARSKMFSQNIFENNIISLLN